VSADQLITLALLGVFHGINPGMGWLFAVSIGMQERSRRSLALALPAIALGHEAAIGLMVLVLTITSSLFTAKLVVLVGGAALLGFGIWQLRSQRHVRWVGMRLSRWQLAGWSFVMSSAHGAGLMVLPVFVFPVDEQVNPLDLHRGLVPVALTGLVALLVHVGAMIVTCGAIALVVYQAAGLSFLRRMWVNLDRVWAVALVGAGTATLLSA
jgi:threonine/homoserine/homoserine lactone efflux protein